MRRSALAAAGLVMGAALVVPATGARASCAARPSPQGQPVIFVGVAADERRGYTRFDVEGVRAGPDLAPEIWVLSGQQQPPWPLSLLSAVGSSGDAELVAGERYVVGASASFGTGLCTVSDARDGLSVDDLRQPVAGGAAGADPPMGPLGQSLCVAGVIGLVVGAVVLGRRSRRR